MTTPTATDWQILARRGITPDNLSVGGRLYLRGTAIASLPDNLSIGGSLDLSDTAIASLPDNLSLGGWLDLSDTAITGLPDNLSVGGRLYLSGTAIPVIHDDRRRGYELRAIPKGAGHWYVAGCRRFESAEDALAHWGGADYPDEKRGAEYCAAIRQHVQAITPQVTGDNEIEVRSAPRWAWNTIDETLTLDSKSKAFDPELREEINRALNAIEILV